MKFIRSKIWYFMLLVVDNGSVFITQVSNALSKNNTEYTIVPFQKISQTDLSKYDSFILSGRRRNDQKMNASNSEIIKHAVSEKKSLLGICYGAEIIALTLGGTIRKLDTTVKGLHLVNITKKNLLFDKDIQAYQSHDYEIAKLGSQLESIASSNTCQHEIIKHSILPVFGTQFHPEMSDDGNSLIESFLKIIH